MKRMLLAGLILAAVALPGAAMAGRSDCSYTAGEEHVQDLGGGVVVYADTDGSGGTTGQADQSAGVCSEGVGTAEAGHSATNGSDRYAWHSVIQNGVYLVADGHEQNGPTLRGYVGVSNFETGDTSDCDEAQPEECSGSNGGGWFGPAGGVGGQYVYPAPIICGDTTGNDWDKSRRDGCRPS